MPLLKASSDESVEDIGWRDALYYRYYESEGPHKVPKHEGVRTRRYKLIHFTDLELVELYDLDLDPDELNSVADAVDYASVRARLEDLLVELRAQSQSPGRTVRLSGS